MKIARRVARGAETLDRIDPTWYTEIDPERLNVIYYDDCVLGQLYGDPKNFPEGVTMSADLGFRDSWWGPLFELEYPLLTYLWKREIRRRIGRHLRHHHQGHGGGPRPMALARRLRPMAGFALEGAGGG